MALGDWSLLCITSLVLHAAAGLHEAGGVDAYLKTLTNPGLLLAFFSILPGMIETTDTKLTARSSHSDDLNHGLGAIMKL